jgi:hypothetical protein
VTQALIPVFTMMELAIATLFGHYLVHKRINSYFDAV